MSYKVVVFDFDGTVADTGMGVKNSVKYAVRAFGMQVGDESNLDYFIGPPLYEGFAHVYGVDEETSAKLVEIYRSYYNEKGIYELSPYKGILSLMSKLHDRGITVAVASSKPNDYLQRAMDFIGAKKYCEFVIGPRMDNHNADKSVLINSVLKNLGIKPENYKDVLMVGDRFYDIEGAKKVGIDSCAVTYGYGTREELEAVNAPRIVDSVKELANLFNIEIND